MPNRLILCSCLFFIGCATPKSRQVTGRLVQPGSRNPISNQQLELDRPPGNYVGIPMFLVGVPQPVAIATATTDSNGRFRFTTTKDRERFLTVRLAGHSSSDFRSQRGYAVQQLSDSVHPSSPHVDFDSRIVRAPEGGFRSVP
jgi:hypothetical protein